MIPRFPHPWLSGRYPYEVFEGTGITPQSRHGELLDRALELQAEGLMTPEVRKAYDCLRPPQERLAVDFFLFNPELCDPDALCREALRLIREAEKP